MAKVEYLEKDKIIGEFKIHSGDTGSCDVQIALLTARINHLTQHLSVHKKDFHTRRGLVALANRRRKLLNYLKRVDFKKYNEILQRLELRR
jgi:small subunit ribosomal protein S15